MVELLNGAPHFTWTNYSVPSTERYPNMTIAAMKSKLTDKMRPTQIFIAIASMHYQYGDWLKYEIDEAYRMNKPIICVRPRGGQVIPTYVSNVASEIVSWNTDSLVTAIRRNARY